MRIMKIVYSQEKSELRSQEESASYMGEESWQVGEKFNGEFIQGRITSITDGTRDYGYTVWVMPYSKEYQVGALLIPIHVVQRVYYGEE